MLSLSGLARCQKKSLTSDRYEELEINFLIFFALYDNKQRKQCKIQCGLRMTFNDHPFLKIKKQNTKVKCLAETSELLNFSLLENFTQVTLDLNLFLVSMQFQK